MHAIRISQHGGPEVMTWTEVETPAPGPGQILLRIEAAGVNYIDTYHRGGLYPMPLPAGIGMEGAGVVEAVGEGVTRFRRGDRAAYAGGTPGSYAEYALCPADRAVQVPADIDLPTAAAVLLKGMTTEFLVRRCYPVQPGQTVLVHAAAGGMGQCLVQWLKAIGAEVIATVGSAEKAEIATRLGADHVILYRDQDVAAEVKRITGGAGVPVAYDGVGKDTFEGTLASLSRRGMFVSFGNSSGAIPPFAPLKLSAAGSAYLTRPALWDYTATAAELEGSAAALFEMIGREKLKIDIGQTFKLSEARQAHEALESRATTGTTLLLA